MKKKVNSRATTTVAIPTELMAHFRKTCINLDLRPSAVMKTLLKKWIEKKKKKVDEALVSNG